MPLYFAYGTNMDRRAMEKRCPRSRPLGRARLARHRLFFMACGAASVMRDAKASVHGVLWELAPSDVGALDRYEEVGRGLYRKILTPVLREPTGSVHALIYLGAEPAPGAPRADHLATILAAAADWALPAAYVAYLQQFSQAYKRVAS
ncbi:gamma-glutamylcyclotransferase family protein [Methylocystis bryophila]|uniref:Gamma-glutamylcyclotransferase n=1 Tax=Methylocystis bryophila TaxID=655015 RepID=A0A1W6MW85_9HYPH|nr:gamma-glutamylcyclotransferase family protein [Methylocystis bryophila]ARN81847.1 gamma-glutamylcyclotransferase [Methylocystis bryophila]BDV37921.1 hypothetical protein DSM21852_11740 [Methylocystis bryophila]